VTVQSLERLERLSPGDLDRFSDDELRGLLETLQWWKGLKASSNESFLPLFFDEHRYLVLKGGGGSGKSIFAGRKVLERVTSESGHRYLVCRKVGRTIRDSCFAQLRGQLASFYPGCGCRVYTGDMRMKFHNGSEFLFAGLDDVEKLKSIYDITGIWIEEASELLEGDFNQLDLSASPTGSRSGSSTSTSRTRRSGARQSIGPEPTRAPTGTTPFCRRRRCAHWRRSGRQTRITTWSTPWASGA